MHPAQGCRHVPPCEVGGATSDASRRWGHGLAWGWGPGQRMLLPRPGAEKRWAGGWWLVRGGLRWLGLQMRLWMRPYFAAALSWAAPSWAENRIQGLVPPYGRTSQRRRFIRLHAQRDIRRAPRSFRVTECRCSAILPYCGARQATCVATCMLSDMHWMGLIDREVKVCTV